LASVSRAAGVQGAAPDAEVQALALHGAETLPVQLRGIDPALGARVSNAAAAMIDGRLDALTPGSDRHRARYAESRDRLGVGTGDQVELARADRLEQRHTDAALRASSPWSVFSKRARPITMVCSRSPRLEDVFALAGSDPRAFGLQLRFDEALERRQRAAVEIAKSLPKGLAHSRLDAGSRQLSPRDPHRENHDDFDPVVGGRGGRFQHRRDAGDGRERRTGPTSRFCAR
jgi:hypothetical protein